ncbi:MAG: CYTH domain-containing protein [Clostridia bacterium]|nr:CYTH domain-containing protein [Clostridia bacterium]
MGVEIEYKLAPVSAQEAEAVLGDPQIAPHLGARRRIRMETAYYDTPDGALARRKYTLRLRREDGAGVCAFKSGGVRRLETERAAEDIAQGVRALLASGELPANAAEALRGELRQTGGAAFVRTCVPYRRGGLSCEIAFDRGELFGGGRREALGELELELKAGDAAELRRLAEYISKKYALSPCKVSKHGRAQRLGVCDMKKPVDPFFVASEMLNWCIRTGYVEFELDEEKAVHYYVTELGQKELPEKYGVDFDKPCARIKE